MTSLTSSSGLLSSHRARPDYNCKKSGNGGCPTGVGTVIEKRTTTVLDTIGFCNYCRERGFIVGYRCGLDTVVDGSQKGRPPKYEVPSHFVLVVFIKLNWNYLALSSFNIYNDNSERTQQIG